MQTTITPTDIAIGLINNEYSAAQAKHLLSFFRDDPSLIDKVDTQYQSKLKELINAT